MLGGILHAANAVHWAGRPRCRGRVAEAAKLALVCWAPLTSVRVAARTGPYHQTLGTAMAAHVLEVSLDNRRLGETQLAPLVTAWRAGEYVQAMIDMSSLQTVYLVPLN